jgi:hypothetical protein
MEDMAMKNFDLELCDEILELVDDLPEKAEEFADSVRNLVLSMRGSIEQWGRATVGQKTALENVKRGVENWLEH